MTRFFILVPVFFIAPCALAGDKGNEALAEEVALYLDEQLLGLVHIDLARLDVDEPLSQLKKLGAPAQDIDRVRKQAREALEKVTRAGAKRVYVVLSLDDLPDQPPLMVLPLAKDADADAL